MSFSKRYYNVLKHLHFKIADKGLFGGAKLTTGNRISEFKNKSRRRWEPSLKFVPLYSETLDKRIHVRLTPKVLKRVDSLGGLDNYIMGQRILESRKALNIKHALVVQRWRTELESKMMSLRNQINPIKMQI
jgi:ribosomal protein L28